GHSPSIMIISGPIVSNAWAIMPSGPGRRLSSTASKVLTQKSISSAPSAHTNLGMTRDELSGIPFTLFAISFSKVRSSFRRDWRPAAVHDGNHADVFCNEGWLWSGRELDLKLRQAQPTGPPLWENLLKIFAGDSGGSSPGSIGCPDAPLRVSVSFSPCGDSR